MDTDPKETKQLTTGEDDRDKSMIERVKEGAGALKDRAIDEAKEYKDPQETALEIYLPRLARSFRSA
jgi:hypothetical protein